jgi:hypothetical protein
MPMLVSLQTAQPTSTVARPAVYALPGRLFGGVFVDAAESVRGCLNFDTITCGLMFGIILQIVKFCCSGRHQWTKKKENSGSRPSWQ